MTTKLNESLTFSPNVVVPNDGDPVLASNMTDAVQPLANRTRYLRQILDIDGIQRVRRVDSLALLAAIAAPADKTLAYVTGLGFYEYAAASTAPLFAPWTLAPATGPGRWVHTLGVLRELPWGLATVDNSRRVPARGVENGLVWSDFRNVRLIGRLTQPLTELGTVVLDDSTFTIANPVEADRIEVVASIVVEASTKAGSSTRLELRASTVAQPVAIALVSLGGGADRSSSTSALVGTHVCTTADEDAGKTVISINAIDFGTLANGFRVGALLAAIQIRQVRP